MYREAPRKTRKITQIIPSPYLRRADHDEGRDIRLDGWVILEYPVFEKEVAFLAGKNSLRTDMNIFLSLGPVV